MATYNTEQEFNAANIWLGMCISTFIFHLILSILSQISYEYAITCFIIMCVLYAKIFMITFNELRPMYKVG